MKSRALVVGGAGFIGSHVTDAFLAAGWAVEVLDDLSRGSRGNVPAQVPLHVADIRSDAAAEIVRRGRFDVVCHLAAQIDVRRSVADPAYDASVNVCGSLNLIEAFRRGGTGGRFVFSSTGGAVYGDGAPVPTPEETDKRPQSPYGTAKLAVEHYLAAFARTHGLDAVSLRYSNVYGPRQDSHGEAGVVAIFCERLLRGDALTVFGDGRQTRDYVHAADVARANLLAATATLPAQEALDDRAFNVGTGVETDVLELVAALGAVAGQMPQVQHLPARAGEQLRSAVDATKAARVLGWTPAFALEEGLRDTYRWFAEREAGEALPAAS